MTQPYSNDLRERVVRAHLAGEPIRQVTARFGVSVSSVPKWVARYRATGSVAPGKVASSESAESSVALAGSKRLWHRSHLKCAYPTLIRAIAGHAVPVPSLDPACCGRGVPEAGPFCESASFSPSRHRPLATRPSADRVRPDWNSEISRSDKLRARRHETGFGETPESNEKLAGQGYDHHPAYSPLR